jgi:cell division protein FtsI (penicillin-binding protein 3)
MLSLADVIRFSSNVGIVQFAERLSPREEYEALRDFGIGTATGIPYSAEANGTLRPPQQWSRQSPASLAMGYETAVTPLQLAMAYAAIANGGELLEPRLIKEIRAPDGAEVFRGERRVVRRVMSPRVAQTIRSLLAGVVEAGTATSAELTSYTLGGKTGTPRRTVDGKYAPRQYNPNFVGLFPADDPQLVVVVKLVNPRSSIYGGRTAAPMTKTIVEAALASRDAAIDRGRLMAPDARPVQAGREVAASAAASGGRRAAAPDIVIRPVVLSLPVRPERPKDRPPRSVPNVRGLTLREAVRSLHSAGFRVQLAPGGSSPVVTEPTPGSVAAAGSLVRLRHSR